MRITLRQLEIFQAICQTGTVTGASREIGLSQAAASQAVAELENLLERNLFDRRGKRLILNSAGRDLLPAAVEVLDRVGQIEGSGLLGPHRLRLAASLTAGNYMLPPVVTRFVQEHPSYRIQLRMGNTEEVIDWLVRFEADAGWIEGLARHPDLRASIWREDELAVVAAAGHPILRQRATAKVLGRQLWVLREPGSGTHAVFENAIAGKFEIERSIEMGGIEAVKRAVLAGGCVACVSLSAIASELRTGELRAIKTPWLNLRREISLLVHRSRYLDPALGAFLRYSRDAG